MKYGYFDQQVISYCTYVTYCCTYVYINTIINTIKTYGSNIFSACNKLVLPVLVRKKLLPFTFVG